MSTLEQIKEPIRKELDQFEGKFMDSMKSSVPLLDRIIHYIVKHKGKQIRPLFVFLSARMFGEINESTFRAAALIELLHTATLVHDDVVDDSNLRRGFFSINALWKNRVAVLVGDYFLSRGLLLSVDNQEYRSLKIVSEAVKEMSEGELLQIEKSRKTDIEENDYFRIIRQKTASLFASACSAGAASVTGDEKIIKTMKEFGELAGTAFQMKDDLLDMEAGSAIGKPVGTDLKSKTLTLPLIYTLKNLPAPERKKLLSVIQNGLPGKKRSGEVLKFIQQGGGIEYTRKIMREKISEALGKIESFETGPAKGSLVRLVEFIVNRPY